MGILRRRYAPQTMAKMQVTLVDVVTPPKINDMGHLEENIAKWEEKVKKLAIVGERVSDNMLKAIYVSMCPRKIQDMALQRIDDWADYMKTKEAIMSIVNNRVAMRGPEAMGIGLAVEREMDQ